MQRVGAIRRERWVNEIRSLRRLLSDLIEQRRQSVATERPFASKKFVSDNG